MGAWSDSGTFFNSTDHYVMFRNTPNHTIYWWPENKSNTNSEVPQKSVNRNHPFKVVKSLESEPSGFKWLLVKPVYPIKGAPEQVLIPMDHVVRADPKHLNNVRNKIEKHIYDEVDWLAFRDPRVCSSCSSNLKVQARDILDAVEPAQSQFDYSCEKTVRGKKRVLSSDIGNSLKSNSQNSTGQRGIASEVDNNGFDKRFRPYCTYAILKQQHFHKRYYSCVKKGKKWVSQSGNFPPCITSDYHRVIHNTFTRVADCFNLPKKTLFSLYALESQFQVNIHSSTGATGIAQLTEGSEEEMTKFIEDYKFTDWDGSRRECSSLLDEFHRGFIGKGSPKAQCSRFSTPENPLQNLMLGAIHFIHNQNQIIEEYLRWRGISLPKEVLRIDKDIADLRKGIVQNDQAARGLQKLDPLAAQKLAAIKDEKIYVRELIGMLGHLRKKLMREQLYKMGNEDDIKIMQELMLYGHNFGQGDLQRYFNGYVKQNSKAISHDRFSGAQGGFLTYLYKNIRGKSRSRRFEMINYVHVKYPKNTGGGNSIQLNDERISDFQPTPEEKALAELNIECGFFSK